MTAITVEQFLSSPSDPEDDVDLEQPAGTVCPPFGVGPDPLGSIADSLGRIAEVLEHDSMEESEADRLREAHDDLDAKHAVLHDLVLEIEEIVKPSTSKLANTVRAAIDRWRGVEPAPAADQPAADEEPAVVSLQPPASDAPVEAWRQFAIECETTADVSQLNRSQIRTLLGLEHSTA